MYFVQLQYRQGAAHGIKKIIWNGHGYRRQSHWVDCDCLYFVLCAVGECLSTLERWEPQWRFLDRWMVKTGFCQRQFRQITEHQRYLNKKLNSELHGEVEFIQTSLKILFFIPQQKWNFISDFRLQAFLSAVCEQDVQSFTVARCEDFLPHSEYKGQMSVKYKKKF